MQRYGYRLWGRWEGAAEVRWNWRVWGFALEGIVALTPDDVSVWAMDGTVRVGPLLLNGSIAYLTPAQAALMADFLRSKR